MMKGTRLDYGRESLGMVRPHGMSLTEGRNYPVYYKLQNEQNKTYANC